MPLLFTSLLSTGPLPMPPAPAPWELDATRVPPDYTLADGNLKATYEGASTDNATWVVTANAIQPGAGKRYWEVLCAAGNAQYNGYIGVVPSGQREDYNAGKHPVYFDSIAYRGNGTIWSSGNSTAYQAVTGLATYGQGALLMFVFDPATAGLWVGKNGVWSHDPVSGAASWSSLPGAAFHPVIEGRAGQEGGTLRSLASQFSCGPVTCHGRNRLSPFSWFFNRLTEKDVKMRVKMGTVVPKMGTFVHLIEEPTDYKTAVAMALHEELGETHRAIKMAMRWTGASERTVKYWFAGERGPSGDHLIALARHSDAVLYVVLALAGRHIVEEADG